MSVDILRRENKTSLSGHRTGKFTSGKGHTSLTFSGTRGGKKMGKLTEESINYWQRRRDEEGLLFIEV